MPLFPTSESGNHLRAGFCSLILWSSLRTGLGYICFNFAVVLGMDMCSTIELYLQAPLKGFPKLHCVYLFMLGEQSVCLSVHVEVSAQSREMVFSFHHMGP